MQDQNAGLEEQRAANVGLENVNVSIKMTLHSICTRQLPR